MESVAELAWNGWPIRRGITGRIHVEYAGSQKDGLDSISRDGFRPALAGHTSPILAPPDRRLSVKKLAVAENFWVPCPSAPRASG